MEIEEKRSGRDRRTGQDRRRSERRVGERRGVCRGGEDRRMADRRQGERRRHERRQTGCGPIHDRGTLFQPPALDRGTILVVDDEPMIRQWLQSALEQFGYTVLQASDGAEALELLSHNWEPIHLVLTDVQMSGMDGLELAERLAVAHPEVKVLFMSGHFPSGGDPERIARVAAHYLPKPFTVEVLIARIRALLGREDAGPAEPPG
ncbi:response regulator [Nitrospira sp. Kam-Ns4a]